ncbi:Hsp20/alpha crystallin family protein [Alicyclobacillus acidoterrestris]|uniref:Hsp20/alpha crystallin family protein n=1 Tax=Alicyclobacillus acidoterrestris (strain ATCC 49025 / DSM 3922 / CIP 106132 / NCIMB 13137 / GD3B) TaxID=1356854 RepID=T0D9A6_ALIAG|nr:Hsp20/alpha crystallin family protein [Alicyclobacillus acidoterrestris]EPZ46291.1 hypothetical protein N007_07285 [Alicyclobacillus acidoterrestris ATCC 49025]UNO50696.1 Hsp20/alpha crystallin family protein [Alicyclobacillus acidoterrestris]
MSNIHDDEPMNHVDIEETDSHITVQINMPKDCSLDDVNIVVNRQNLYVYPKLEVKTRVLRPQIVPLPTVVDDAFANGSLQNGLLQIKLPKLNAYTD